MNAKEFFDKVKAMRAAQKEYFRGRDPYSLRKSKQLEAEIDREIKRVTDIEAENLRRRMQPDLFGDFDADELNNQ